MTYREAEKNLIQQLTPIYGKREARSICRIVFEDLFHLKRPIQNVTLGAEAEEMYANVSDQLIKKVPVQYIVGHTWFYGKKFLVNPDVLIPRPETEELVHWIISDLKKRGAPHVRILDIGTGSGCIALALKSEMPSINITAVEKSPEALKVAIANANQLNEDCSFVLMDVLDQAGWDKLDTFDVICSNPPYISPNEKVIMGESVIEFEPKMALFPEGNDHLIFYKSIAKLGKEKLSTGGWLYFELNEFNSEEISNILSDEGYSKIEIKLDLQGKERMVKAQRI